MKEEGQLAMEDGCRSTRLDCEQKEKSRLSLQYQAGRLDGAQTRPTESRKDCRTAIRKPRRAQTTHPDDWKDVA